MTFYADATYHLTDPCQHCGACLSFCAWDLAEAQGRPAGPALCRDCQLCYHICPRLPFDRRELAETLFPGTQDSPWRYRLGSHTVHVADQSHGVQDGGVTTCLAQALLETGRVEAVLATGRDENWRPGAYWATTAEEVARASRSKYSTAPALAGLQAGLERYERIAVIALPCQAAALARFQQVRPALKEQIKLVIGLFCTETFYHGDQESGFVRLVEGRAGKPIREVERFDSTRGRLFAYAQNNEVLAQWRMKEVADVAWPICHSCVDLTAEYADLSIGSIGSGAGSNSLIIRSQRGQAVIDAGVAAGRWSLEPLQNPGILEKLASRKRGSLDRLSPAEQKALTRGSIRGNWKRRVRR